MLRVIFFFPFFFLSSLLAAQQTTANKLANYLAQQIELSKTYDDDSAAIILLEQAIDSSKNELNIASDTFLAAAYYRLGIHYYYTDQELKAIAYWKKASLIREGVFPNHDIRIIKGYRNIGNAYNALKYWNKAQLSLTRALDLNLNSPKIDTMLLVDTYRELGYTRSQQGDIKQANIYLDIAQDLGEQIYADAPWELAMLYNDRYNHEKRRDNAPQMLIYGQKSIQEFDRITDKYPEDDWTLADFYNNLAIAHFKLSDYQQAQVYYQKALHINGAYEERKTEVARNYANLIGVHRRQGQYEKAHKMASSALEIIEALDKPSLRSLILDNQAELFRDQGDFETTLQLYQEAITHIVPGFRYDDIYTTPSTTAMVIGDKPNLILMLHNKAEVLHLIGEKNKDSYALEGAATTYDSIAKLIDLVRLDFEADESKSFLTNQAKPIFEKAIQVNLDLYASKQDEQYLKNAFNFVERSKAVILLDAIKESQAKISANIPNELLDRERQFRSQIQALEQNLLIVGEAEKEELRGDFVLVNRQLERLIDTLEQNYASYHRLKYSNNLTKIKDVQDKLLRPNQAMVQYFIGEKELYIFYIPKAATPSVYTIPLDFPLTDWVNALQAGIYKNFIYGNPNNPKWDEAYAVHAWKLYSKLLLPIAQNQNLAEQLVIVPDGVLGYIPFDALLTKEIEKTAYNQYYGHPYLLRDHVLSYTYSATLLQTMNEATITPEHYEVLAFAPSFGQGLPTSNDRGGITEQHSGLSPLLHNKRETNAIQELWGGKNIVGTAATKQGFLDLASQYSYLHLSSHARMNDEQPDYSYIAFTQTSNEKLEEEQLLFVRDLYNVPLHADMVVLSGCETGLGKLNQAEGIISLARAFSYAGARSVITTLWRVNDQETANLMIDFYTHLHAGKSKDEALWLAKKRFLDEGIQPHPYYWAGFTPIGNMGAIKNDSLAWKIVMFGGIGILLFYLATYIATSILNHNKSLIIC